MPVKDKGWFVAVVNGEPIEIVTRKIRSTNVDWIGWPRSGEPLMIVQFSGNYGSRYAYLGVSRQKAVAAAYAESTGVYLARKIKPHYEAVKIR